MKFTANRKIMLEYLKTMISVVPKTSPVQELKGFLVEANEDDGHLYLTANNQEVAIQRKFKPAVESGGNFVMEAKLLVDILTLLGGDDVVFEELCEVDDDNDVSMQLVQGIKVKATVVPERDRVDPRTQKPIVVKATVKPACKFSQDYREKLQEAYENSKNG